MATAAPSSSSVPVRPLLRLAAVAVGAALLVAAAGWVLQGVLLGLTEEAARARVESDVRRRFDQMAQQLRTGTGVLADPALVQIMEDETGIKKEILARSILPVFPPDLALRVEDINMMKG